MDVDLLKYECPSQSNCNWKYLFHSTGKFKDLSIYKCDTCSLQALYPRPDQKNLYTEDYYNGNSEYSYIDERNQKKYFSYVWDSRLSNIQKYVKEGNFLDIGSSFGGFLERAKNFGYNVFGVEISKYASEYANKELGIPTFNGNLFEAKFPDHFFSVITMIEVIEHIENPKLFFYELTRILKPGGLLLLQTANFEGWQAINEGSNYHYYMPGHVYYYSNSNLKNILTQFGFSRFFSYFGVDFSLLAKLKKSRAGFTRILDYLKWFRISYYHILSKFKKKGYPLTSSYVLYAFKK